MTTQHGFVVGVLLTCSLGIMVFLACMCYIHRKGFCEYIDFRKYSQMS